MNCIEKTKTLLHFTSANCLLFVSTLSGKRQKLKVFEIGTFVILSSFLARMCETDL